MDKKLYESLRPHVGALVRDEALGRIGVLMAVGAFHDPQNTRPPSETTPPPLAYVRPFSGGREWTTQPEAVTVLESPDALLAKLRWKNEQSTTDHYGQRG